MVDTISFADMDSRDQADVAGLLQASKALAGTASFQSRKLPQFSGLATQAMLAYRVLCEGLGVTPEELYDDELHAVARMMEQDQDFIFLWHSGGGREDYKLRRERRSSLYISIPETKLTDRGKFAYAVCTAALMGMDMEGLDAEGRSLAGLNLMRAKLDNANLRGVNLSGANLQRASLEDADLTGASLRRADLTGAAVAGSLDYADTRGARGLEPRDVHPIPDYASRDHLAVLRKAVGDLAVAAIPTKPDVFMASGAKASELRDAIAALIGQP